MKDVIDNLINDVNIEADSMSATVIQNAFLLASISCPSCKYPEFTEEFSKLHKRYSYLKLELYQSCKWYKNDHYGRGAFYHNSLMRKEFDIECDIYNVKHLKNTINPCSDCIKKYNPTSKLKKYMGIPMYGKPIEPKRKGFLDYE